MNILRMCIYLKMIICILSWYLKGFISNNIPSECVEPSICSSKNLFSNIIFWEIKHGSLEKWMLLRLASLEHLVPENATTCKILEKQLLQARQKISNTAWSYLYVRSNTVELEYQLPVTGVGWRRKTGGVLDQRY